MAGHVCAALNAAPVGLSDAVADSPRAAGDAIERAVRGCLEGLLGGWCVSYEAEFARRAMADVAFWDKCGGYCVVDVKTHRVDTEFNMPALVSVKRLAKFYEERGA